MYPFGVRGDIGTECSRLMEYLNIVVNERYISGNLFTAALEAASGLTSRSFTSIRWRTVSWSWQTLEDLIFVFRRLHFLKLKGWQWVQITFAYVISMVVYSFEFASFSSPGTAGIISSKARSLSILVACTFKKRITIEKKQLKLKLTNSLKVCINNTGY